MGIWLSQVLGVDFGPTSTSRCVVWASKGQRGFWALSHQGAMCAQPPALSTGKYTPPTFFSETGNVGLGPMQSHVCTSSDRNGKSSKALEQGSGIIVCFGKQTG